MPRRVSQIAKDREELRRLLMEDGVLHAGPEQPIRGRDGRHASWMFYSWNCSLTARGAQLAGRLILDKLQSFDSRQLATFGYTGVPLMAAAILQGDERYTGLVIREARKVHGASRQIDGPADKSRSVVVIDDSLSSGTSLRQAITALEEDGFQVEGAVVLVNFPYRGGLEWASALGYRVEWIFDAWEDLSAQKPTYLPGHKRLGREKWAEERLPDGLHPATAARRVTEHYLRTGAMLLPPRRFDRDVDGRGGVFVSFRARYSDERLVREGFWHFDPAEADPCRDLVLATVKTVISPRGLVTPENLPKLKIAATFFSLLVVASASFAEDVSVTKATWLFHASLDKTTFEEKIETTLPDNALSDPQQNPDQPFIERIDFDGNRRIRKDTLQARIFSRAGDPYNEETLRRDFQALWNTQFFEDVKLEVEDSPDKPNGKIIVFIVKERPVIRRIRYEGIKSVSESDILDRFKERKVGLTVESQFDPTRIKKAEVVLKELLGEHGRQFATVTPQYENIASSNAVILVFKVDEGPKVKVGQIKFTGNHAFSDRRKRIAASLATM